MTTSYSNTNLSDRLIYSLNPQITDTLSLGIITQQSLSWQGNTQSQNVALFAGGTTVTAPFSNTILLNNPKSGPLLVEVQGSDGYRYMLARFDGTFSSTGAYVYSGTSNTSLWSETIPVYTGVSTVGTPVFISSGVNDSYTIVTGDVPTPKTLKIYTYGGFVTGLAGSITPGGTAANNVYDGSTGWIMVGPANVFNGAVLTAPTGTITITVGDYYWLKQTVATTVGNS